MQPNQNPNQQPATQSPEQPRVPGTEQLNVPAAPEVASNASHGATIQPTTLPTVPPPPNPGTQADPAQQLPSQSPQQAMSSPAQAGDVDVIEKEWVDQANAVIEQTKDDPYTEEEAVESLQQDYLKKRYGHDVKKPNGQ